MLIKLSEILALAEERKIAVGAFNCTNLESLQAVLSAAEELHLPVILQHAQNHEDIISLNLIGPIMVALAQKAKIPVAVHLDHGKTVDYLRRALQIGFTGVMMDGSTLPYEENVHIVRETVSLANYYGADVEAELGCMGAREGGMSDSIDVETTAKIYTNPLQARSFVEETGIKALACSFGTTHGIYLSEPKLDFDVVREVRRQTGNIPVVMHGGSGVQPNDYHTAVKVGVRKINYFTYMDKSGGMSAAEYLRQMDKNSTAFFTSILFAAREGMKENIKAAMRTFSMLD